MLGLILNNKEVIELEYILKRELEEILCDLSDPRLDEVVKRVLEEKYHIVFGIYKRFGSTQERLNYTLRHR